MKKILSLVLAAIFCAGSLYAFSCAPTSAEGEFALTDASHMIIDGDAGVLYNIAAGMTADEVKAEFAGDVTVGADGSAPVKTGTDVSLGDASLKCAVYGDMNGDGKINVSDVTSMLKKLAKWDGTYVPHAMDVNIDGKENLGDVTLTLKYIAKWDVNFGAFKVVYSEEKIVAENEDASLLTSVIDIMRKVSNKDVEIGDSNTLRMQTAKNEAETCQILMVSKSGHEDLSVSFTDFSNGYGKTLKTEMFWEHYVSSKVYGDNSRTATYPDPLPPVADRFNVTAGRSQGLMLKVTAGMDAEPGLYVSTVKIKNSAGKEIKKINVYTEVWDIDLPDDTKCATAFGLSSWTIYGEYGQEDFDDHKLYKAYYDFLLENRVCAYYLPYDFDDPKVDSYLDNPRVTAFTVDGTQQSPFPTKTDEDIVMAYEKLSQKQEWLDKAYFYYVDEPYSYEQVDSLVKACEKTEKLFPGAFSVVPCYSNNMFQFKNENGSVYYKDTVEIISEYPQVWCPISSYFTPYNSGIAGATFTYGKHALDQYGPALERFNKMREEDGDRFWWYICVGPQYPYANFFVNCEGSQSRVFFWQQYQHDIDGCLYWSVTNWHGMKDWSTADNEFYSGDGLLIYSGRRYGMRSPIGSFRLENIRDGIEDFEYLKLAESLCGKDAVNEVLENVTTGILEYTTDGEVIAAARVALAEMIMAAKAN